MKAMGYQPNVGLKVGSTPARQSAGPAIAYGDGSGYDAMARGFGTVLSLVEKEREEDMVADVTAAKNEYDKRISDLLYNEENGLMHKKLANARGIGKTFEEEEKKIRADILPMLPKYEKAHIAFANLADKDSQRNFNTVRNYSLEQKKAYRDVNLTNSINFKMENAQHYYKDPSAVKEQLDAIYTDIRANCENEYGAEWCKSKFDETEAKVVASVVETAYSNGDNDAVRSLINVFGDRVPPSTLNRWRKGLVESDKDEAMLTTAEQIAKEANYDITKIDDILANHDTIEIEEGGNYYKAKEYKDSMQGVRYKWGGNDKNGIDCSAYTQQLAHHMSVEIPRTADAQCKWAEENGRFRANDGSYKPQAGDLVFIVNTDPKNKTAYKNVTHVGMVDENGNITQAGSSKGVGSVPMSAFAGKIIGYGTLGVTKKKIPLTAKEKQERRNRVLAICNQKKAIENERIRQRVDSADDAMWELHQSGVTDRGQFEAVARRYADDPEVYRQVKRRMAGYIGGSGDGSGSGGSGGYGKVSRDGMAMLKDAIDMGRFLSEDMLTDALDAEGVSPADRRSLVGYYRKVQKDTYDWVSLKADFQRDYGKNNGLWLGAKAAAQDFIQDYVEKNGGTPSYSQIYDALTKAAVKPQNSWWASNSDLADYEQMGLSNAAMRAMSISNARENGDGTVTVTYPNGRTAIMDEDDFYEQADRYGEEDE